MIEPEAETTPPETAPPPIHPSESYQPPALDRSPPLAILAGIAAVADLVLRRGLLRTISDRLERSEARILRPWFDLAMNLAAIAGMVAVTVGLFRLLSARLRAPWHEPPALVRLAEALMRAVTAGFAGILLPSVAIATFLPAERTNAPAVFASVAAGYFLALQVSFMAARFSAPLGLRAAVFLSGTSVFCAFIALFVGELGPRVGWTWAFGVHRLAATAGELAYLAIPLAILPSVLPERGKPRTALAIAIGMSVGLCAVVTFDVWRVYLGQSYDSVLYGALRLETFLGPMGLFYGLPFGLFVGLGLGTLCSPRALHRQLGAALLVLLGAGFGPRTPGQLLMLVLGVTLLARATIAASLDRTYGEGARPGAASA